MYTDYEVTSNNGNYRKFVPWFKDFVDGFEIVDKLKLPEGIAFAHKFKGVVYTYLNYLVQQNKEIGNVIKEFLKSTTLRMLESFIVLVRKPTTSSMRLA